MVNWWLLTVTIICIWYVYVWLTKSTNRRLPNGAREPPTERGWPILGILPNIQRPLCRYLLNLGEKHGSLFRIKFGLRNMYVLNNYSTIRKCLKEDGDNFSGRWRGRFNEEMVKGSGVILIDGELWAKHRSFILKVLRDFGLGKSKTTEIVQEECSHLLSELGDSGRKVVDFSDIVPVYTVNIISKFLMSKRYERHDEDFKFILNFMNKYLRKENKMRFFHFVLPIWDNSSFLTKFGLLFSYQKRGFDQVYEIFRKEIANHSKNLDLNSEGDDLMDRFLIEQSKIIDKTGTEETFTEFQLIRSAVELFIAGFETTSTTLGWSLLFLSRYQEMQRKMHDEIVELLGPDQMPSMNDRKSLILTQAIMDEIMRLGTVVPLSIVHRNFKDKVIDGIFIEKNSLIFPNIYACHMDANKWEKPLEFYPEHFLVKDNEGVLKYNPREELIPFGIGKRQCLGESLARAEFFIFLVSIIQRFKVRFADEVSEEDYRKAVIGGEGLIRPSIITKFIFEKYE